MVKNDHLRHNLYTVVAAYKVWRTVAYKVSRTGKVVAYKVLRPGKVVAYKVSPFVKVVAYKVSRMKISKKSGGL